VEEGAVAFVVDAVDFVEALVGGSAGEASRTRPLRPARPGFPRPFEQPIAVQGARHAQGPRRGRRKSPPV